MTVTAANEHDAAKEGAAAAQTLIDWIIDHPDWSPRTRNAAIVVLRGLESDLYDVAASTA